MTTHIEKCPTCNGDAVYRCEQWESVAPNGDDLNKSLHNIKKAIEKHYLRLDKREPEDITQDKALREIESILGMQWRPGEITRHLEDHPRLKPFYK